MCLHALSHKPYQPLCAYLQIQVLTELFPWAVTSGGARSPPSDTDERPVRKQLKETSIDSSNDKGSAASAPDQGSGRKRSFEETRGNTDDTIENGDGPRKRSRECTPEDAKKENSAAVPVPHNVSEPTPKDPVPAAPRTWPRMSPPLE
jgi:hypothetical protein